VVRQKRQANWPTLILSMKERLKKQGVPTLCVGTPCLSKIFSLVNPVKIILPVLPDTYRDILLALLEADLRKYN